MRVDRSSNAIPFPTVSDFAINRSIWVWLALGFLLLVVVTWGALKLRRGGKVYFSHPNGFTSFSFGTNDANLRPVPVDRYERILQRFIQGDLFDCLWIARHPKDGDGGLVLSHDGGEIKMAVSFRSLKEPNRLMEFRNSMKLWDYVPETENSWNVGMGEDLESVTLDYRFKRDIVHVKEVAERALGALEGPEGSEVFVHAWSSQGTPRSTGIKVVLNTNFLEQVP